MYFYLYKSKAIEDQSSVAFILAIIYMLAQKVCFHPLPPSGYSP